MRSLQMIATVAAVGIAFSQCSSASAQNATAAPAVGVMEVAKRPITEKSEFLGRIEAINRVNVVARLTAFLDKRLFVEGDEVSANAPLYRLERGPFEADLKTKKAQVDQLEATLANARIVTDRQRTLLRGPAGLQSNYDSAIANQKRLEAQL